jgi:hypothetical protein
MFREHGHSGLRGLGTDRASSESMTPRRVFVALAIAVVATAAIPAPCLAGSSMPCCAKTELSAAMPCCSSLGPQTPVTAPQARVPVAIPGLVVRPPSVVEPCCYSARGSWFSAPPAWCAPLHPLSSGSDPRPFAPRTASRSPRLGSGGDHVDPEHRRRTRRRRLGRPVARGHSRRPRWPHLSAGDAASARHAHVPRVLPAPRREAAGSASESAESRRSANSRGTHAMAPAPTSSSNATR